MKKERLITDEIEQQNDYLAISILDIITSWQTGFDKVNEMYGTDIQVELNPVLVKEVVNAVDPLLEQTGAEKETEPESTETAEPETVAQTDAPPQNETIEQESGDETEKEGSEEKETEEPEPEQFAEQVEELKEVADEIVEISTDTVEGGETNDSSDKEGEDSND